MVQPSPEILSVSRRWLNAVLTRDEKALRNLLSTRPHLRFVGTDAGELWAGEDVRQAIGDFFGVIPDGSRHEETFGEAFEDGPVGWSCFVHRVWIGERSEHAEVRTTLVLSLEDGTWKIVQRHGSVPVPTEQAFNMKQVGIADLVAAARAGYQHDQSEGLSSVVFTDIVNSSVIAAAIGDRMWTRIVADHFVQLRRIIEGSGGHLVKSMGDGTLSRFTSARKALRATIAIQRAMAGATDGPDLALRVGVHTGDVVQSEDDFFGTVVNKAARLMALAGSGQIAVSDATRAMVADDPEFAFAAPETVELKGFDGKHALHRLIF